MVSIHMEQQLSTSRLQSGQNILIVAGYQVKHSTLGRLK
jgi:hypothetical protein